MRLIGHLDNEEDVRKLSVFLNKKGIETSYDGFFDANTGHMSYQLWGVEEDQIPEALEELDLFLKDRNAAMYDLPLQPAPPHAENIEEEVYEEEERGTRFTPFTAFIIAICGLVFLLNMIQETAHKDRTESTPAFFMTDVQLTLFYDVPAQIEKFAQVVEKYNIAPDQTVENLNPEAKRELIQLEKTPFWRGIYDWILLKTKGESTFYSEGPMFGKIREGEFWRFFSPAILHVGLLHLLFNMIWAWVLGRPIEQRIGWFRLALLILFVGVGSNTAQYLMGGPFFLGYSGVVMGLAGFTWMREKQAPWEGYPMQKATMLFLAVFVGAMCMIQVGSFFMQIFTSVNFSPNIANTAHITGALLGALLGRFSYFSERVK